MSSRQHRRGRRRRHDSSIIAMRAGHLDSLPAAVAECPCPRTLEVRGDVVVVHAWHEPGCPRAAELEMP